MRKEFFLNSSLLVLTIAFALSFRIFQNTGTWVGGEISFAKSFWLSYALLHWFISPWIFVAARSISPAWKTVFRVHLWSWYIRGVIELLMIYRFFNWSPIYGISHDVFHILLLFFFSLRAERQSSAKQKTSDCARFWVFGTVFSTAFEAVFAALFMVTRGQGSDLIYFASDDPRYALINQLTTVVCIVVYLYEVGQSLQFKWAGESRNIGLV